MRKWLEKPYHSLDYMLQDRFKEKVYKITLLIFRHTQTPMHRFHIFARSFLKPSVIQVW